jgi:hypothetical protein
MEEVGKFFSKENVGNVPYVLKSHFLRESAARDWCGHHTKNHFIFSSNVQNLLTIEESFYHP